MFFWSIPREMIRDYEDRISFPIEADKIHDIMLLYCH